MYEQKRSVRSNEDEGVDAVYQSPEFDRVSRVLDRSGDGSASITVIKGVTKQLSGVILNLTEDDTSKSYNTLRSGIQIIRYEKHSHFTCNS